MIRKTFTFLTILGIGAMLGVALFGCSGEGLTGPGEVNVPTPPQTANVEPAPVATPEPTPEGDASSAQPWAEHPIENGIAVIHNDTHHVSGLDVCYFKYGPHPQDLLDTFDGNFPADKVTRVPFPDFDVACGKELKVQIDVTRDGHCKRPSNDLNPLIAYGYKTVKGGEGVDDTKTETTYSDWSTCTEAKAGCNKTRTVTVLTTVTNSCTQETETSTDSYEETEQCECACVVEETGTHDVGRVVWDPAILSGTCEESGLSALCAKPCHQLGVQKTETTYTCEEPPTFGERSVCRDVKCEPTTVTGICHISNKGYDGNNWNLQVSYKKHGWGHYKHLNENRYCPADFRSTEEQCTVANAYRKLAQQNCPVPQ